MLRKKEELRKLKLRQMLRQHLLMRRLKKLRQRKHLRKRLLLKRLLRQALQ
jgi:hypothetical protein